jgi:CRISPR-associated protein Cas2
MIGANRMMYLVLVIYDISNDKRRARVSKFLKGFGFRVQNSAFECNVNLRQYNELTKKIEKMINIEEDLLRIYKLTSTIDILTFGNIGRIVDEDVIVI